MNGNVVGAQPAMAHAELPPLPAGWTEHKAPTGHTYYFNKSLNKSTYTRPQPDPSLAPVPHSQPQLDDAPIPRWSAGEFAAGYQASQFQATPRDQSHLGSRAHTHTQPQAHQRHRRRPDGDRPKHKYAIPDHAPWVLVKTKYGRRFVHNTQTGESLWRFPEDVMKGVVEFDRRERERAERRERGEPSEDEDDEMDMEEAKEVKIVPAKEQEGVEDEESEYEEVTDSEGDDQADEHGEGPRKRQRTEEMDDEPVDEGPRELGEEDMLWMLEQQQQGDDDYGEEEYYEGEPPLSENDSKALFRDLLDDSKISPFTPWDRIIEEGKLVDDDRYTVLTTMKARRDCFDEWSRERIQAIKEQREKQSKMDPKIPYFQLLDEHANTKLYWPEFKRKFRKESAMKDMKLSEKDKEKFYREHAKRLAMPKDVLKKELSALLKPLPLSALNRDTSLDSLPSQLITDLRFISLPPKTRNPMIEAYTATLPAAPANGSSEDNAALEAEKRRDRERREKALREREDRVQEAKLKQSRDLKYGRQRLQEKEAELERAMKVSKDGLRGHFTESNGRQRAEDEEMGDAE